MGSGIWRILRRLGLSRLLASQRYVPYHKRWQRYEEPEPGHQVQIDVKFIAALRGSRLRHYQFTAIDDCTRLRVLRLYERLSQKTAIQFFDYVLQKLPFRVERIQTGNGSEFGAAFHWHVQDLGIEHVYIRARTPRSTARSSAATASTPGSSIACSMARSSTTASSSRRNSRSGRTTTTSSARMAR